MASFPVPGGTYSNDWGNPRHQGPHRGTDIFAPRNTGIYAVEGGKITKMGWNNLGGWRVWINGKWYYAHLDHYAKGLHVGSVIQEGQLIGYVGNTGDAKGGATHLHLGYDASGTHGANWQNPYPLLRQAQGMPGGQQTPTDSTTPAQDVADQAAAASVDDEQHRVVGLQYSEQTLPTLSPPTVGALPPEPPHLELWRMLATQPDSSSETQRLFGIVDTGFGDPSA